VNGLTPLWIGQNKWLSGNILIGRVQQVSCLILDNSDFTHRFILVLLVSIKRSFDTQKIWIS